MIHETRAVCLIVAVFATSAALATSLTAGSPVNAGQRGDESRKPSVAFKATPPLGIAPLKVRAVVDLKGGADDYADFYCATVEWDWADGNISSKSEDCKPYEAGKSSIERRFSAEHTFREDGNYEIAFRLKQKNRIVGYGKGTVRVRGNYGDSDQ